MNPLKGASAIAPQRLYRDDSAAQLVRGTLTPYRAYPHRIDDAIRHVYAELGMRIENMPRPGDLGEWKSFLPRARAEWAPHLQARIDRLQTAEDAEIARIADPLTGAAHVHGLLRVSGLSVAAAQVATFCDPREATPETIRELIANNRHSPTGTLVLLTRGHYQGAKAAPANLDFDNRRMHILSAFVTTLKGTP